MHYSPAPIRVLNGAEIYMRHMLIRPGLLARAGVRGKTSAENGVRCEKGASDYIRDERVCEGRGRGVGERAEEMAPKLGLSLVDLQTYNSAC